MGRPIRIVEAYYGMIPAIDPRLVLNREAADQAVVGGEAHARDIAQVVDPRHVVNGLSPCCPPAQFSENPLR